MSEADADTGGHDAPRTPTAEQALHATFEMAFDEAVDRVQLEHELGGFETVQVTRLDRMVEGALGEDVARCALIVVCHAEVASAALAVGPEVTGLLPCTTAVYEREDPDDDRIHVHHVSATKAARDLGVAEGEAVEDLVSLTGERMGTVWENVERLAERSRAGAE